MLLKTPTEKERHRIVENLILAIGLASVLMLLLLLSACGGNNSNPSNNIPSPQGGWVCFACSNMTLGADGGFSFPNSNGVIGYIYTSPLGAAVGKTISLDYTISGYPPTTFQPSSTAGAGPAAIRLFMWRRGDDLKCDGQFGSYRWWAQLGAMNLAFGEAYISALIDPGHWTNCWGQQDPNGFAQAVSNLLGIGFTFGAEFYGHGAYATGPATFKINDFTVK